MNYKINKANQIRNLFLGITTFCTFISSTNLVSAQITPDKTLSNYSEVGIEGNITKINGGTRNEGNLFHSFKEFGVSTGGEAHFNNAAEIQNILTRVTGNSISNIDGLIKANGAANLFLINPNGIVFGRNAKLDIGGSFVGSTADSLIFPDNLEFSAVNPAEKPLLSVNVPLGLQYGTNPGNIQVKGDGEGIRKSSEIIDTQTGLRVKSDKTLALIGGDINLEGATLKTAGGRIELGSVKGDLVDIIPTEKGFYLGYDAVKNGGNIDLSQQAAVDASGEGAGDIQVWGKNIKLVGDSQIETSTLGSENGGNLVVNAQNSVEVIGASSSIFRSALIASVLPEATGNGGNLTVNTQNLLVRNGGGVGTTTFGKGNGGNLNVNAQKIELIGTNIEDNTSNVLLSRGGLSTSSQPIKIGDEGQIILNPNQLLGDAGELTINTDSLIVKDGAQISTATSGNGKGGNLNVNARDIQLIGTVEVNGISVNSGLFSSSEPVLVNQETRVNFDPNTLLGDAGNLNINANSVTVKDGGQVNTSTLGKGNAGNLKIKADKLLVENGAAIGTDTFGEGKGGNLTVNSSDVQLIGGTPDGKIPSQLTATATPISIDKTTGEIIVNAEKLADAGDITINSDTLLVKDGALVSSETLGKGNGGDLTIKTRKKANCRSTRLGKK